MKINWGHKLTILYCSFVAMILSCVAVAISTDFHLVEKDYYQQELAYQDRIDAIKRTKALGDKISVEYDMDLHAVKVIAKDSNFTDADLKLYHPLDAGKDVSYKIADTANFFNLPEYMMGKYIYQLAWKMEGKDYYLENSFFIP